MGHVGRDKLLETLKLQGLAVFEVSDSDAAPLRAAYGVNVGPDDLLWEVPDARSKKTLKVCVVYCGPTRTPPFRGGIRHPNITGLLAGTVTIDEYESGIWLEIDDGTSERMNGR